jgi:hypothetical protein
VANAVPHKQDSRSTNLNPGGASDNLGAAGDLPSFNVNGSDREDGHTPSVNDLEGQIANKH